MEHPGQPRGATLSSLPNEILSLILGNFCLHCVEQRDGAGFTPQAFAHRHGQKHDQPSWVALDSQALHAVCLVSARFRDAGQRVLYHQFIPGHTDSFLTDKYSWSRRLIPFLRTVARRRDLAALVQHVQLELNLFDDLPPSHVQEVLADAAQARAIDLHDFLARFRDQSRSGNSSSRDCPQTDELITMLIACLPNLTRLNLSVGGAFEHILSSALRAVGVTSLSIQAIDVCGSFGFVGSSLDGIFELGTPFLTTLCLEVADGDSLQSLARLAPCSLRHLYITEAEPNGPGLAALLSRCAVLETFVYETGKPSPCNQAVAS